MAPPVEGEISALIDRIGLLAESDLAPAGHPSITTAGDDLVEAYVDAAVGLLAPDGPRTTRIAYTPLHGVGAETFLRAAAEAGFEAPAVVADQADPDPDFPTAPFPNPEEAGVLDRLLSLASEVGADVALAHDPDADRLAVAVPDGPRWRLLTGDEAGCLLAEHLLSRTGRTSAAGGANTPGGGRRRLLINTVVSSRLLHRIAVHHDADWAETLTGFKWIMKARSERAASHDLVLGYEDALGYTVGEAVSDKDGISAALVMAELVAELAAEGRTLSELLDDLHRRRHGVHATGQRSIRFESTTLGPPAMTTAMAALREAPPMELAGGAVTMVCDLATGVAGLPPTDAVIFDLGGHDARTSGHDASNGRVIVRPSGTEPKMKVYAEVVAAAGDGDAALRAARVAARTRLGALLDDTVRFVAGFERPRLDAVPVRAADPDTASRAARMASADPAGTARADDLRLIVRCTDLTALEGDDTPGRIRALCAQAVRPDPADPTVGPVAAVCVYPALVGLAAELLEGTAVAAASVAGAFPSGLSPIEIRVAEVRAAVAAGADEIDTVLNRSAFLAGRSDATSAELRALREAAGRARLKVILEVGELGSASAIATAVRLAIDSGADMIKTSTGKAGSGASPEAVLVMAEAVAEHYRRTGRPVGIEVSGGVRTGADALGYVAIVRSILGPDWLTPGRLRFDASSLLANVIADLVACRSRV